MGNFLFKPYLNSERFTLLSFLLEMEIPLEVSGYEGIMLESCKCKYLNIIQNTQ